MTSLLARPVGIDSVVAAVADEEHASLGVREVLRTVGADAAVVTEPTELRVATALGPGGEGAHATEEWVSVSSCEAVARSLVAVAERRCA